MPSICMQLFTFVKRINTITIESPGQPQAQATGPEDRQELVEWLWNVRGVELLKS